MCSAAFSFQMVVVPYLSTERIPRSHAYVVSFFFFFVSPHFLSSACVGLLAGLWLAVPALLAVRACVPGCPARARGMRAQVIVAQLNRADAQSEDQVRVTDNAVSALGKILIEVVCPSAMSSTEDSTQLAQLWLSQLPRSGEGDEEECCSVHEDLVFCVENPDRFLPVVGGAEGAHMEQILSVFVQVLKSVEEEGATVATPETQQRMRAVLSRYAQK